MIYYEELENGDIGRYTNSAKIAQKYGWTGQTEKTEEEFLQEIRETQKQEQPTEQTHEKVDPTILALAEAVAAQEVRLSALEGGEKA